MSSPSAARLWAALTLALVSGACSSSGSHADGGPTGSADAAGSAGSTAGAGTAGSTGGAGTGTAGTGTAGAGTAGTGTAGTGGPSLANFSCAPTVGASPTPTYFVDFAAGSDTADGRASASAWKHAPGDAAATGMPAAVKLTPGDVVLFKGGVVYLGSITIPASGQATQPVVYDGNSAGTWGTGLAIIDGEEKRAGAFVAKARSYVVIDSFVIRSFDKAVSSVGVSIDGGSHNQVLNCRISDVYYPKNPGGKTWEKQSGTGIAVNNSPQTVVRHNSVRDVGNAGITFTAGGGTVVDGGEVSCNEVTNMNWGIAVALGNSTAGTKITGVAVLGNYIHDFDQYYVSAAWHRDGLFVFSRPDTGEPSIENMEIAYNYFEDNTSATGSTAWIYLEYVCRNFNIHHNVLNASRSYYAIRILGDGFQVAGNHVIANNLIDNANGIGDGMHIQESSGIKLRNNIFYDDGNAYIVAKSSMAGFSADYDLIYRVGGAGPSFALNAGPADAPGGDKYDLTALQAATGFEAHGLYGDPLFQTAPKAIDADPTGFVPAATSPAVDHGGDVGYSKDFLGKPIPAGAAPDIGPFEHQP
jgi:Right handed beta helix region